MKRSEMVNLIACFLDIDDRIEIDSIDNIEKIADTIIYTIEEAGMLPPNITEGNIFHYAMRDYCIFDEGNPQNAAYYFCRWEPENE